MTGNSFLHDWLTLAKQYGPLLTWGTAASVVSLAGLRWLFSLRRGGRNTEARWASRHELRKAYLLGQQGIVLGRIGRLVLRYCGRGHILVIAGTQSGKSRSLVTTTLLDTQPRRQARWGRRRRDPDTSVIAHDPKGELYEATAAYRATVSRVLHIAPCQEETSHFNPLDVVRLGTVHESGDLGLCAEILSNPEGLKLESEGARHFVEMTEIVVKGLVVYGLTVGGQTSLGELYHLVTQGELAATFERMRTLTHPVIRQAGELMASADDKQYSGIVTTLGRVFSLYGDPRVAEMVSYSDFSLSALREEAQPVTIYLSVPFGHIDRCMPLTRLLLRQWLGYATDAPRRWAKLGWKKLLLIGEEFPDLKRLEITTRIMNHGAGLGVQLCLISPSMNAIEEIWGRSHPFLDNSHVQAYFGIFDERIAERISKRLGTHTVRTKRIGSSGGRRTVSVEDRREPLMDSSAITHMDPNDILILARNHQIIVQQTPWDEHEPWASRGVPV